MYDVFNDPLILVGGSRQPRLLSDERRFDTSPPSSHAVYSIAMSGIYVKETLVLLSIPSLRSECAPNLLGGG